MVALHARLSGQSILAYLMPSRMENGVDTIAFQSWTKEEFGYNSIPNLLIDHAVRNTHVPVGFWRGVNTNQNAIYMECFIDELAHAAGKDPLEFRRALLVNSPKHLAVLNAVAEKAGWGKPPPQGVFRGICQNYGYGSYTAAVAEVSVSPKGELKVHRIVAATDPGYAVNPQQIEAQVQGSFVYGLSAVLFGEITIDKGRAVRDQLRHLSGDAARRHAEGGDGDRAIRWVLGRRRRTDDRRRGAGGAECDLRRDGQAHPHLAAEAARSQHA